MKPRFFKSQRDLRAWFEKNHAKETELLIGLFRVHASARGVVYKQALDEALCFGWIDGVRRGIDDDTWAIRFTPRKKGSIWSKVNIKRAQELIDLGLMAPAGKREFDQRDERKAGRSYSFENDAKALAPEYEARFMKNSKAWRWFSSQAPYFKKVAAFWVMSAKKEETRERRLSMLIGAAAKGARPKPLTPPGKKK